MDATARAGLACGALLLAFALPSPGLEPRGCPRPAELRARAGRTLEIACAAGGAPAVRGPARRLFGLPIDPNRADALTLETLPGIGPARARAILAERCRRPFASVAELERVSGIGPRTLAAIAPSLALGSSAEVRCAVQ